MGFYIEAVGDWLEATTTYLKQLVVDKMKRTSAAAIKQLKVDNDQEKEK